VLAVGGHLPAERHQFGLLTALLDAQPGAALAEDGLGNPLAKANAFICVFGSNFKCPE
jgi:hypothetical protein